MNLLLGDIFVAKRRCLFWERALEAGEFIMFLSDTHRRLMTGDSYVTRLHVLRFLTSSMIITSVPEAIESFIESESLKRVT